MRAASTVVASSLPRAAAAEPSLPARALGNVLVVAFACCLIVASYVLVALDGWNYYRTPLGVRGYHPAHPLLRPSGTVGLGLGLAGALSMLATVPYFIRKRWRRLAGVGTLKRWLEIHIFFGIVGPVLITLHTSFKFNGIISAGYWLMMTVWASGFVGRYLYVRIPKSIRGADLSVKEVEAQRDLLRGHLAAMAVPEPVRRELDAFESATSRLDVFIGELRARVRLALMRRELRKSGVDVVVLDRAIALAVARATLARRLEHLHRTRRLFDLWHVFHRPLVSALFVIVVIHVGIAIYLGYVPLLP